MKSNPRRQRHAFTLIEMIGVLAVISILASLLIPKIYEAINNAHVSQTLVSCQTIKTSVAQHYAKFLSLASSNGDNLSISGGVFDHFDNVLLAEALIDKPFSVKIGTTANIRILDIASLVSGDQMNNPNINKGAYVLDGDGKNDVVGQYVVEAVIYGLSQTDARDLNNRLDGSDPRFGETPNDQRDPGGQVTYANPTGPPSSPFDVHIYITHH